MEQRINEGYVITDSIHIGNAEFVIGENQTKYGTMYVTWRCKDRDNFFWGHYLSDRQAAERDLLARAEKELDYQIQRKESAERASKGKDRER